MGKKKKNESDTEVIMASSYREEPQTEQLRFEGIPCKYLKIKDVAVPTYLRQEPVYELKLESKEAKYRVDSILYGAHSVFVMANGEAKLIPLGNVAYATPT